MNAFIQAATVLLPSAYLITAVMHGMAFAGEREPSFARRLRPWSLAVALLLHVGMFAARWSVAGTFPIDGAWLVVSAVALMVAALFALIASRIHHVAVGGIVFLMVTLLQTGASAFGPVRAAPLAHADAFKIVHVVTLILAAAALVLSGLFGYLHLLLLRQMRRKRFGPLFRQLPDLEQLSRLTRRAALAGFLFLAAGLNLGIALAHQRVQGFDYRDPAVLLTIGVWLHFGLIAFSRWIRGFTARRASIAAVAGLVTLLVTILITLIPVTFHRLS